MLKSRKWRPIASSIFLILLLAVAVFIYFLLKLNILPLKYLIPVIAGIALLICLVGVLLFYRMRKKRSKIRRVRRIIGVILSLILTFALFFGSVFLYRVDQTKSAVIAQPGTSPRAVVGVYVKNDDPAQSLSDMSDYCFAFLADLGVEKLHSNYALGKINESVNSSVEAVSYSSITDAADALRSGDVQALAVSKSFLSLLKDSDDYADLPDEVRLIEEIPVPQSATLENTPILITAAPEATPEPTPKPTPEPTPEPIKFGNDTPLIFYLSGMDKSGQEIVYNAHADVNILMAINPTTKQVLLVSTPRDTFVTNFALGGGDKLTHCAYQGVANSIKALEYLYTTHVDKYCRINFTGFEDLVDLIGGITLDNPVAFDTDPDNGGHHFEAGIIELDGYEALCYARERHHFGDGDLARGRNQVRVLTAILDKVRSNGAEVLLKYSDILDALAGTFETDLTSSQISDLVRVALGSIDDWDIRSYSTWGGAGIRSVASMGNQQVSIIWPNANSVKFASKLLEMISNDEIITDEVMAGAPR